MDKKPDEKDSRLARYAKMDREAGPVTDSATHQALFRKDRERDDGARAKHMIEAARESED